VVVSHPVERSVTDYAEFTARLSAVDSVEVRARVDGYLDSVHFEAGALVKKGDVLFVIDQRPFVRELNRAKAQLEQAQAEYKRALTQIESAEAARARADADLENRRKRIVRAQKLLPQQAMTQQEFDDRESELHKAEADVRSATAGIASANAAVVTAMAAETSARAALALAELNLEYTTVTAPVSGRKSGEYWQPDPGGPNRGRNPVDDDRVGGPDVRLLRRGRTHGAPRQAADPRGQGRNAGRCRNPSVARPV
jgi:multidrug resistance efflux pump